MAPSYNDAMNRFSRLAAALVALAAALPLAAQTAAPPSPPPGAAADTGTPEPRVQHLTIEDEGARIEELRVRGQTQRIVVKPRGAAAYEVLPAQPGRDAGSGPAGGRDAAAGRRVWPMLSF